MACPPFLQRDSLCHGSSLTFKTPSEGGEPFDRLVAERALQDGCDRDEAIRILVRSPHAPKDRPSARERAVGLL